MLIVSRKKVTDYFLIFIVAQLGLWYGGLADLLPVGLVSNWNRLQLLSTVFMAFCFALSKRTPNIFTLLVIASNACLVVSTWWNEGSIDTVAFTRMIALVLLIDYFYHKVDELLNVFMIIFEIMIYYNFYTIYSSGPDLFGGYYGALGYDNGFTLYALAAYAIALLCYERANYIYVGEQNIRTKFRNKRSIIRIRSIFLIIFAHLTVFYPMIGTGIAAILMVDVLAIIYKIKKFNLSLMKSYLIYIGVEIFIVFLRVQEIFSYVIVKLLNKDLSFTGRTNVWDRAIKMIARNPIIGYGYLTQSGERAILGDVYCHNALLEQFFRGGIPYFAIFVVMIYLISKSAKRYKNSTSLQYIIFVFCGILLSAITESNLASALVMLLLSLTFAYTKNEKF